MMMAKLNDLEKTSAGLRLQEEAALRELEKIEAANQAFLQAHAHSNQGGLEVGTHQPVVNIASGQKLAIKKKLAFLNSLKQRVERERKQLTVEIKKNFMFIEGASQQNRM